IARVIAALALGYCVVGDARSRTASSETSDQPVATRVGADALVHQTPPPVRSTRTRTAITERDRARVTAVVASGDPYRWKPVLGEYLNPRFDRSAVIDLLTPLLRHSDREVRVTAARLLLELGSYGGVAALQEALKAAAAGAASVDLAEAAAETLHRYRQAIDP